MDGLLTKRRASGCLGLKVIQAVTAKRTPFLGGLGKTRRNADWQALNYFPGLLHPEGCSSVYACGVVL